MPEAVRKPCPRCGKPMLVLVDRAGKTTHPQCAECEEIDPLEVAEVIAWTESEGLKPPTE